MRHLVLVEVRHLAGEHGELVLLLHLALADLELYVLDRVLRLLQFHQHGPFNLTMFYNLDSIARWVSGGACLHVMLARAELELKLRVRVEQTRELHLRRMYARVRLALLRLLELDARALLRLEPLLPVLPPPEDPRDRIETALVRRVRVVRIDRRARMPARDAARRARRRVARLLLRRALRLLLLLRADSTARSRPMAIFSMACVCHHDIIGACISTNLSMIIFSSSFVPSSIRF